MVRSSLPSATAGRSKHEGHHFRIACRGESKAALQKLQTQFGSIDQRSVMREGQRTVHGFDQKRLGIACGGCTHGRVTRVADRLVTSERGESFRRKYLGEQTDILV
jgi:hypothetical protein